MFKKFVITIVLIIELSVACSAAEYPFVVDFSIAEFDMLCAVVEREARDASLEHKEIIAQVIINRVKCDDFPNTIFDVLHQKNQFTTIRNYYRPKFSTTVDTIVAVYNVLTGNFEDITDGATFFYAPAIATEKAASWFEDNKEFLFEFEFHRYFK